MRKAIAVHLTSAMCLALASVLPVGSARAQKPKGASYAQSVLDEISKRHPELKGMELAARRGDGCVTVAATDRGDVGDSCDGDERKALRSGELDVDDQSRKDRVFIITEQLHDSASAVIGLIITDISSEPAVARADALNQARAIRLEVEARIPSEARLAPAATRAAPAVDASYAPRLDAKTFASAVTNPYFPLVPGTTFRYRGSGESKGQTTVTTVTHDTREILGIGATVVHDQVFEGNELKEDTYDWYAQDGEGNVWYLGEDTKEYKNGRVSSALGSWEAGVGGAQPGIMMWADPAAHRMKIYRQEYLAGAAEDMGKVISVSAAVQIPFGKYQSCVETEDTSALEPGVKGRKFYCRGVGLVRELEKNDGSELVAVEKK